MSGSVVTSLMTSLYRGGLIIVLVLNSKSYKTTLPYSNRQF
jgi:hypothetical protein